MEKNFLLSGNLGEFFREWFLGSIQILLKDIFVMHVGTVYACSICIHLNTIVKEQKLFVLAEKRVR